MLGDLVPGTRRQVPQLVGVADDVDRGDPCPVDGHAQRMIELAVEIDQGAKGAVDDSWFNADVVAGVLGCEADEETRDLVGAYDRIPRSEFTAATVGDRHRV